jgi:hypothetical protein
MNAFSRSPVTGSASAKISHAATDEGRKRLEHDAPSGRLVEEVGPEAEKARARFERLEKIRAAVFERAAGRCEAWFEHAGLPERCGREAAVMDRWESSGRDVQQEGIETHWALCVECSLERVADHRSAAQWRRSFELHSKASQRFTSRTTRSA